MIRLAARAMKPIAIRVMIPLAGRNFRSVNCSTVSNWWDIAIPVAVLRVTKLVRAETIMVAIHATKLVRAIAAVILATKSVIVVPVTALVLLSSVVC
jgi:hypothetical protein